MKRILFILNSLDAGGAETFLMKVYRTLSTEEYQFDFIVSKDGGCYTQEVLTRGGRIYAIPMRTKDAIGALNGIRKIVRDNCYECVMKLGDNPIAVVDLLAAKLGGAKYLAMRSCNALTGLSIRAKIINTLLRPVLNTVANVKIAPSILAAEYTFGKYHAHRDVHLLHNGVDLKVFRYDEEGRFQIRKEFGIPDKLVIGHVGRFHEQKNHRYLLEIFKEVCEVRTDAILLLVGIGKLENMIREYVKELDLQDVVVFAGQRFDIPQILSAMDVFVFPSLHEGMPNTVIEAQATGLPCVIADTITLEANITGLVTYMSLDVSSSQWAQKVLLMATEERRNTVSDFLEQGYDIEKVSKELVTILGQ